MPLEERSGEILSALIREFIATGEPVSSGTLYDKYDFGIKPAMIRWELKALNDLGYLEQPNYSAGRVPTDRGYEYYSEYALEHTAPTGLLAHDLLRAFERHAWTDLVSALSDDLGLLSAATPLTEENVYKNGLERLIRHFDWQSRDEIRAVVRDFEEFDERAVKAKDEFAANDDIQVYVGKKSPVTRCDYLSVVTGSYDVDGGRMVLFAIGPKRMDYQRTARVFKNLKEQKKKHE